MAKELKTAAKTVKEPKPKYVTEERFNKLEDGVGRILDMLEHPKVAPEAVSLAPESVEQREVRKAGPNEIPMNPEWEELAKTIIGDAVERCEINYVKNGGVIFTVVIKPEFSNATRDYLERYKVDRRSKEVGSEGIEGVENWCKLIKSNLSKGKPVERRT